MQCTNQDFWFLLIDIACGKVCKKVFWRIFLTRKTMLIVLSVLIWFVLNCWYITIIGSRLIAKTREHNVLMNTEFTPILTLLLMILKLHSQTPWPFLYDFVLKQFNYIFEGNNNMYSRFSISANTYHFPCLNGKFFI